MEIELRLLKCALALAEHGNFARGAKAVHLSQPSLSRNIQELEHRLGVPLFVRSPRGVEPTAAGVVLLKHARAVMEQADTLVREMSLLQGLEPSELSVGAGVYPGQMFVDRAIGRLVRDYPAASISIVHDSSYQLLPHLLKQEFDLAVVYLSSALDQRLEVIALKPHQMFFVVRSAHPLARSRSAVSMPEIVQYPTCTTGQMPPEMIQRFRMASGSGRSAARSGGKLKSIPTIGCESLAMMKPIVEESDAVGILPFNVVEAEVRAGTMTILPVLEPWMLVTYGIARLRHRVLPLLGKKLIQATIDADAELAEHEKQNAAALLREHGWSRKDAEKLSAVLA